MAVHKAIRSNPPAQPQAQPARRPDHQLKADIFETLRHLNRGFGVVLAALDKLETKDRQRTPRVFPVTLLQDYRTRTEGIRALANHDLLLVFAGREEQEAERFGRLSAQSAQRMRKSRS